MSTNMQLQCGALRAPRYIVAFNICSTLVNVVNATYSIDTCDGPSHAKSFADAIILGDSTPIPPLYHRFNGHHWHEMKSFWRL